MFEVILKVTKGQGSTLSIEDAFLKKPHRGWVSLTRPDISGLKSQK